MKNSCLPEFEKQRLNNKMRFQSQHADMLAKPKKINDKYEDPNKNLDTAVQKYSSVSVVDRKLAPN